MITLDALLQADRHCDIEGLPPASQEARMLATVVLEGRLSPREAVQHLVDHHSRVATKHIE
jgi:hypothetical protein